MTYIDYGDLLARFCLSFVFLWSGVSKTLHPEAGRAEIAALGLPNPAFFLPLTIACQICGGLMVLLGFWARLGALLARLHRDRATAIGAWIPGIDRRKAAATGDDHLRAPGDRGWLSLCNYPWRQRAECR
jgi:putative oxidoreductase